jgi:hypothetical protein
MQKGEKMKKKYEYVGNCLDSFDENGLSMLECCFQDVSHFAQMEEDAQEISAEVFYAYVTHKQYLPVSFDSETIFLLTKCEKVMMAYLPQSDTHYFFRPMRKGEKNVSTFVR